MGSTKLLILFKSIFKSTDEASGGNHFARCTFCAAKCASPAAKCASPVTKCASPATKCGNFGSGNGNNGWKYLENDEKHLPTHENGQKTTVRPSTDGSVEEKRSLVELRGFLMMLWHRTGSHIQSQNALAGRLPYSLCELQSLCVKTNRLET